MEFRVVVSQTVTQRGESREITGWRNASPGAMTLKPTYGVIGAEFLGAVTRRQNASPIF